MLHFAYGSTLNLADYARRFRAEHLRFVGLAGLPDHEIRFSRLSAGRRGGVLNLAEVLGSVVAGALFEVDAEGWADLDRKEGHPHAYARRTVVVIDEVGEERVAVAYVAPDEGFVRPAEDYVAIVREGMRARGVEGVAALERAAVGDRPGAGVDGVFVYGTLLRGECRGRVLRCFPSTPGRIVGGLVDCASYPGLVAGEGWVQGELVAVTDPVVMRELDGIEGFPGFGRGEGLYRRTLVRVACEWPARPLAWTYRLEGDPARFPPIPNGSWRARHLAATGDRRADALRRIAEDVSGLSDAPVQDFDPTAPGRMTWGGADVVVADGALEAPEDDPWGRWARNRFVITPHARALGWLLLRLRDEVWALEPVIDKYTFYGQIGAAVVDHHARVGWSSQRATLLAVLDALR
jgi:gamma-glutamylcyclotransferase (GGCT)/AIG2-like uncharacterized protein YtfP